MKKRVFAILLALCVLFGAVVCCADEFADDWDELDSLDDEDDSVMEEFDEEEDQVDFRTLSYGIKTDRYHGFGYKLNDDGTGLILTCYEGYEEDVGGNVVFPAEIEGIPVVEICIGMCDSNPLLVNIEIPGSIELIGNNAFGHCENLKSVKIGEGTLEIGTCAFGACLELETVELPDSLHTVGPVAFGNDQKLKEVVFGNQLKSIGKQAFFGCSALTRVVIPGKDDVVISEDSFEGVSENCTIEN